MTNKTLIGKQLVDNIAHEVLSVNHNVIRWSNYPEAEHYNELAKQSLNMISTFLLIKQAKYRGVEINETRIPYIALKRLIEKTVNGDIRDDHLSEILQLGGIDRKIFDKNIDERILKMSNLSDKLLEVDDNWNETKIYKIATKMATLVELKALDPNNENSENVIVKKICSYGEDFPWSIGIALDTNSQEVTFLKEISQLRGAIRWRKRFRATDCSVLEHLGESAIFSWLMSKAEEGHTEEMSTKAFWMGLFHDIAERWTGDMDSPLKDSIEGLREAVEKFEEEKLKEHVYNHFTKAENKEIATSIEEFMKAQKDETYRDIFKSADYASAAMECFRNIMCGSRDDYFLEVLKKDYKEDEKINYNSVFLNLVEGLLKKVM